MAASHTNQNSVSSDVAAAPKPSQPVRASDYDDDDALHDGGGAGDDQAALLEHEKTARPQRTRRASSVLQFDFSANQLYLAASAEDGLGGDGLLGGSGNGAGLGRRAAEPIGLQAGIALIVGMQIGSGIFSSPGVVAKETGAVASALLSWVGAGLLSWAG